MAGIAIKVTGVRETQQFMRKIARAIENSGPSDRKLGHVLIRRAKERILEARKGDIATGRLGKSHNYKELENGGEVVNNAVYAYVQQEGGTITPTTGKKFLAIPIPRELRRTRRWPSQFPDDAFNFVPDEDGGLLFASGKHPVPGVRGPRKARGKKKREGGGLAYVLRPSVTIPPMVEGGFLKIEEEDIDFYTNDILRRAGLEQ